MNARFFPLAVLACGLLLAPSRSSAAPSGTPVKIVDQCDQETIGTALTFVKSTDNIVIDGKGTRTQTKGGRGNCSAK